MDEAAASRKPGVVLPSDSFQNRELSPVRGASVPKEYAVSGIIEAYSDRNYKLLKAFSLRRKCDVVIKVVDLESAPDTLDLMRKEVEVLRRCKHENIVYLHEVFNLEQELWMVWDCMDKGSCKDQLRTKYISGFPEDLLAHFMLGTLQAICYFHAEDIIHRDLRADCILLNSQGHVKVTDFQISSAEETKGKSSRAFTFVGTPSWMAPEVLEQEVGYNYKADIWSLGITAWELAAGKSPFEGMRPLKVLKSILMSAPPRLKGRSYSEALCHLVSICLVRDPAERPDAEELLEHGFFEIARRPAAEELVDVECLPLGDPRAAEPDSTEDILWTLDVEDVAELEHMTETELQQTPEELAGTRGSGGRGSGGRSRGSRVLSRRTVHELKLDAQREEAAENQVAAVGREQSNTAKATSVVAATNGQHAAAAAAKVQPKLEVASAGAGTAGVAEQEAAVRPAQGGNRAPRLVQQGAEGGGALEGSEGGVQPHGSGSTRLAGPSGATHRSAMALGSVESSGEGHGGRPGPAVVAATEEQRREGGIAAAAPEVRSAKGDSPKRSEAIPIKGGKSISSPRMLGSPRLIGAGKPGKRGSMESGGEAEPRLSLGSPQTTSVSLRLPAMSPSMTNSHVVGKEVEEECEICGERVCECPGRRYHVVVERDDVWKELEKLLDEPSSPVKGHGGQGIEMPPVMSLDDPGVIQTNNQHSMSLSQDGVRVDLSGSAGRRTSVSTSRVLFLQDMEEINLDGPEGQSDILLTLRNPSGKEGEWAEGVEERWSQPLDDETRERRRSESDMPSFPDAMFDMDVPSPTGSHDMLSVDRAFSESSLGEAANLAAGRSVTSAPVSASSTISGVQGTIGEGAEWLPPQGELEKGTAIKATDIKKKKNFLIKDVDSEFSASTSSLASMVAPAATPVPTSSTNPAPVQPASQAATAATQASAAGRDGDGAPRSGPTPAAGSGTSVAEGTKQTVTAAGPVPGRQEEKGPEEGGIPKAGAGEPAAPAKEWMKDAAFSGSAKGKGVTGEAGKAKSRFAIKDAPEDHTAAAAPMAQVSGEQAHAQEGQGNPSKVLGQTAETNAGSMGVSDSGPRSPPPRTGGLSVGRQGSPLRGRSCEVCSDCCAGRNGSCVMDVDVDRLGEKELRQSAKELQSLLRSLQRDKRQLEDEVKKLKGTREGSVRDVAVGVGEGRDCT